MTLQMEASPITKAEHALYLAQTPQQSKEVEAMAAAAKAWAKEQNDYELVVNAARVFILSRRKTTELIKPNINHGGDRKSDNWNQVDNDVHLISDYGFTQKQWNRRCKELEVEPKEIDDYIDDCIEKNIEPTVNGLLKYINSPHVSHNSGENEWYTPSEFIEAARNVMGGIDLDPASSELANKIVGATVYFTEEDDGLQYAWDGRVWMNPPYSSDLIGKFCEKLSRHYEEGDISQAIVLVNNATETSWFQRMLDCSGAICFKRGRVKFIDMDGNPSGAPLQGQAMLYFGENIETFNKEFSKFGKVLCGCNQGQNT